MLNPLCFALLIVIVNALLTGVSMQLQCRGEDNQPVDWFFMYKIPKISQTSNPLIREGLAYAYITSDNSTAGWKLSAKSVGSKTSIPGYTLAPLYTGNDSILWTLYNDHAPDKDAVGKYGHTKGLVMADVRQGFWLIHSVPRYPPPPDHRTDSSERSRTEKSVKSKYQSDVEYGYPESGKRYGQSFLCISIDKDQFNLIGIQFMYNQIILYKNNLPTNLADQYPSLTKAANKMRIKVAPYNHKTSIRSLGGMEFLSFAKSDKWGQDLYADFVAPQLGVDLFAETWRNSRDKLPSKCHGLKVLNIVYIRLNSSNNADVVFSCTKDHSKWAVSSSKNKKSNWVCIGDINRDKAQSARGGGTVCLNSLEIWSSYYSIVGNVETCPNTLHQDL